MIIKEWWHEGQSRRLGVVRVSTKMLESRNPENILKLEAVFHDLEKCGKYIDKENACAVFVVQCKDFAELKDIIDIPEYVPEISDNNAVTWRRVEIFGNIREEILNEGKEA